MKFRNLLGLALLLVCGSSAHSQVLTLSPTSLTFGNQNTGTTSPGQTMVLTNTGTSAVVMGSISFTGTNPGDFAQTNNCPGTLSSSGSCTITVTFTPAVIGARTATLQVNGTQVAPIVSLSPPSLGFGNQPIRITSSAQTITLTNTGTSSLTIASVGLTGANLSDYAIFSNTCGASLAVSASCVVGVNFTPSVVGSRTANLTFTTNAASSPDNVPLSGTGQAPVATFTPTPVNFGGVKIGLSSGIVPVTLTNTGNATMTITSITIIGTNAADFTATTTCGATLGVGLNCAINVTFTPPLQGTRNASINLVSNTVTSPDLVPLTGIGFHPISGTGTLSGTGTIRVQP